MKKHFQLITLSTLTFFALVTIVFSSCEKQEQNFGPTTFYKPCANVVCLNGGACTDGYCFCPLGFEGEKCATRSVDKFVHTYQAFNDCYMDNKISYTASIEADFNPIAELKLKNVSKKCSNDITAFVRKDNTNFDIPFQSSCGSLYVSGEGNRYDSVLNINLVFRDSANHSTSTCSIIMNIIK